MLTVMGVALEVIGLVLTAIGLWRTYDEFGPERVSDKAARSARAVVRPFVALAQRLTRLFRKPQPIERHGSFGASASLSAELRGRKQYGSLGTNDVRAALVELDDRTHELMDKVNDVRDGLQDTAKALRADIADLVARLDLTRREMEALARRVAVDGLKWSAWGIALVALGLLAQGADAVLGMRPVE